MDSERSTSGGGGGGRAGQGGGLNYQSTAEKNFPGVISVQRAGVNIYHLAGRAAT